MPSLVSSRRSLLRSSLQTDSDATSTPGASSRTTQDRDNSSNRPPTPEYQPLETPLNPAAQRALVSLLSSQTFRSVKGHIHNVTTKLTEIAGETNERVTDARLRFDNSSIRRKKAAIAERRRGKSKKKTRSENEEDEDDEVDDESSGDSADEEEDQEEKQKHDREVAKLENLEKEVKRTTQQLEQKMRTMVDVEYRVDGLKDLIKEVADDAEAAGNALHQARRRAILRERGAAAATDDADVDRDGDLDMQGTQENENVGVDEDAAPTVVPSQMLKEKMAGYERQWEQQSLTQRYTTNNAYIGFYRIVHNAKHPGDETPPVPHPSTWFNHLEQSSSRPTSSQSRQLNDEENQEVEEANEEDDVEIERERISLRCPITLRTFEYPVKTAKCMHSFEREAIENMIRASSMMIPAGPRDVQAGGRYATARRVRAAPCPVCSTPMTLNDLEPDLVLVRRVRRMQTAMQREQEDEELGDGNRRRHGSRGKSRAVIESEDDAEEDSEDEDQEGQDRVRIKRERSRLSTAATTVDGEDENEEDEEEEEDD